MLAPYMWPRLTALLLVLLIAPPACAEGGAVPNPAEMRSPPPPLPPPPSPGPPKKKPQPSPKTKAPSPSLPSPPPPPRTPSCLAANGLVQIAFQDAKTKIFVGSPSVVQLPDGALMAAFAHFGTASGEARTNVTLSRDGGATWRQLATVKDLHWGSLFINRGELYMLGTDSHGAGARVAIARSTDWGLTWNRSILITPPQGCTYATGTVPVLQAGGYLYRGMEYYCGYLLWPRRYQALMLYAKEGADLTSPESWAATAPVPFTRDMLPDWLPAPVSYGGYLESSAVRAPDGSIGLMMRVRVYDDFNRSYTVQHAGVFKLVGSPEARGAALSWRGLIDMPGGGNKFNIRYDAPSGQYLALANPSVDRYGPADSDPRNILALVHSPNLLDWRIAGVVLLPNDGLPWAKSVTSTSYHAVDFVVDEAGGGDDLLAVVRTSCDGAANYHNSNRITFKRVRGFRSMLQPQDLFNDTLAASLRTHR